MKKTRLLFLTLILISSYITHAQNENKFKIVLEAGIALSSSSDSGILIGIEPKYDISSNSTIGLRLAGAIISGRYVKFENESIFVLDDGILPSYETYSIAATFDKYFNKNKGKFIPFIGGGIGFYKLSNQDDITTIDDPIMSFSNIEIKGKVGFLIRSGFEFKKLRLDIEYNIIPKSDLKIQEGETIGTVNDSYFGISLGIILGGGKKWKQIN